MSHTPNTHEVIAILAGIAVLTALTVPKMVGEEQHRLLAECEQNQRNVTIALEMYSTDYAGRFPAELERLVPNYLATLPTCPTAERDTYKYLRGEHPDHYVVSCSDHLGIRPFESVTSFCPLRP